MYNATDILYIPRGQDCVGGTTSSSQGSVADIIHPTTSSYAISVLILERGRKMVQMHLVVIVPVVIVECVCVSGVN